MLEDWQASEKLPHSSIKLGAVLRLDQGTNGGCFESCTVTHSIGQILAPINRPARNVTIEAFTVVDDRGAPRNCSNQQTNKQSYFHHSKFLSGNPPEN